MATGRPAKRHPMLGSGAVIIFATVGTQLPFDRLMLALDRWAAQRPQARVTAQTGRSATQFSHMACVETMDQTDFARAFASADVIVSHAGMGTILSACEMGKPIVLMPRRACLGEHRNDHQLDTATEMAALANVTVVQEAEALQSALDHLLVQPAGVEKGSATASATLIANLQRFIFQPASEGRR